mmetsp:Transcript_49127/g.116998  ORF Transcript_49127/g.116998 Transcript_49127/m.116998 type:complete len:287 (+) Transcript_49127:3935-4795(+)
MSPSFFLPVASCVEALAEFRRSPTLMDFRFTRSPQALMFVQKLLPLSPFDVFRSMPPSSGAAEESGSLLNRSISPGSERQDTLRRRSEVSTEPIFSKEPCLVKFVVWESALCSEPGREPCDAQCTFLPFASEPTDECDERLLCLLSTVRAACSWVRAFSTDCIEAETVCSIDPVVPGRFCASATISYSDSSSALRGPTTEMLVSTAVPGDRPLSISGTGAEESVRTSRLSLARAPCRSFPLSVLCVLSLRESPAVDCSLTGTASSGTELGRHPGGAAIPSRARLSG